ncbi:SAM-dependent methyltransferase [Streptomyces albogriseolus]
MTTQHGDGTDPDGVDWDARAAAFDEEPDHGLRDPRVRAAWAARLKDWLPGRPGDVLDLGCGTGSLSLLAAEQGHRVTGVDRSPAMVELARQKLAGRHAVFLTGDAPARRSTASGTTPSSSGMCCGRCPSRTGRCGAGATCCGRADGWCWSRACGGR